MSEENHTGDAHYMRKALALAKRGVGFVNPNPLVGAVIVRGGEIIGQGFHERFGGAHAEINAIKSCKEPPEGATLYVTLEPCCHQGKTPPCTKAVIESKIKRVVIGCTDPNPKVSGRGIALLKEAGVAVTIGILEVECRKLNEVFFHYVTTQTPYVVMKYAMTMDGKIATAAGKSKWITGEGARKNVGRERNRYMGIMVGVGTVLADNPSLTCRIKGGRDPVRIICDTNLRTPLTAAVVTMAGDKKTIIATACDEAKRQQPYLEQGCRMLAVPKNEGHLDLKILMSELAAQGIDSIFLEGGGTLNAAALQSQIVQKAQIYLAPKLFGGETAKTPIGGVGIAEVKKALHIKNPTIRRFQEDIFIEGEVSYPCLPEL